jgi:hypothetical protein
MTDAALDHPMVRDYLRQLTEALASLPPPRAAELRDQIAGHLDDELAPGASDEEVADAIRRVGTPADLAREAGARPRRTLRSVIRRRSWRFWTSLSVVIATAGVLIGLLISIETAPVLRFDGSAGWWYPQDYKHEVDTSADAAEQSTVPVRWHQQQGFFVEIQNLSGYTQTVLGYAPGTAQSPGNALTAQLGLSAAQYAHGDAGDPKTQRYVLPVSIPPGQSRYLRVLWTQGVCMAAGSTQSIDELTLRVRVGWITRTEAVGIGQAWAVEGTRQSTCAGNLGN